MTRRTSDKRQTQRRPQTRHHQTATMPPQAHHRVGRAVRLAGTAGELRARLAACATGASGCNRLQSANGRPGQDGRHWGLQVSILPQSAPMRGTSRSRHARESNDHDVMPTRVSSTMNNKSDTQRTTGLRCCPPYQRGTSAGVRRHHLRAALATLLASCCLLLRLASLGQCAPTTTTATFASHSSAPVPAANPNHNNGLNHRPNQIRVVEVRPIITVNQARHGPPIKQASAASTVAPTTASSALAHHGADQLVGAPAASEDASSAVEDETILLVLDGESSPSSSFRRLIKRSGISDQRLAEIQMIRALKKQLERAATKIAAESGGGGGGSGGGGGGGGNGGREVGGAIADVK